MAEKTKSIWSIAIHGGAGTIPMQTSELIANEYKQALQETIEFGATLLKQNLTALDTVERVIKMMEDNPLFNAGKGAVYTEN